MNKGQFIQQAKNIAREEAKKSFDIVVEQTVGGENIGNVQSVVESAQPVNAQEGANVEEIRAREQAKMVELRKRLDEEMQRARGVRQQANQEYVQQVDQQMQADKPKE